MSVNLEYVASVGNLEYIKRLAEQGVDIHANGDSALLLSAKEGHLNIVKYLVEQGANIPAGALILSARNGHIDVIHYLYSVGAKL